MKKVFLPISLIVIIITTLSCSIENTITQTLQQDKRWGIYSLDLATESTQLIYSSSTTISNIRLNPKQDILVFSRNVGGESLNNIEIFTIELNGENETRLTNNEFLDTYPIWSTNGEQIAYLSWPGNTLDIYIMDRNGENNQLLYDSGAHDADIDWVGDNIVFTRDSQIWIMRSDGSAARAITNPPRAGVMGKANLPFGDYDPRINPKLNKVIFDRLEDDESVHGNYNLYEINIDGTGEKRITETDYAQGLPSWSPSGNQLVYIVAAIEDVAKYDMYIMNSDGTENRNITPDYFPANALIHEAIFSRSEETLYIIVEWWE